MIPSSNKFHNLRREIENPMSVTEESGGRLNAFAKEPKIEVISQEASSSSNSRLLIFAGVMLVIGLITYGVFIS